MVLNFIRVMGALLNAGIRIAECAVVFLKMVLQVIMILGNHELLLAAVRVDVVGTGVYAQVANNTNMALLQQSGVMLQYGDDQLVIYESKRMFHLETLFEAPTIQNHQQCLGSQSANAIKNAELRLSQHEFKSVLDEFGQVSVNQTAVKATDFNMKGIWRDGGQSCATAGSSCTAVPLLDENELVPCKASAAAKMRDRKAGVCQEINPNSICCSISIGKNGCAMFSRGPMKLIERALSGPQGRRYYDVSGTRKYGRRIDAWCLEIVTVTSSSGIQYQKAMQAKKKRSTRSTGHPMTYWSLGGPFSDRYINQEIERVRIDEQVQLDQLSQALANQQQVVVTVNQTVAKLDKLRAEVCNNTAAVSEANVYSQLQEYFHMVRSQLERAVDMCDEGHIPDIFRGSDLANLCRTQSSASVCHRAARRVFQCRSYSIKVTNEGLQFLIQAEMFIPLSESQVEVAKVINIGRFTEVGSTNVFSRIVSLPDYAIKTGESVLPLYRKQCSRLGQTYRCSLHTTLANADNRCIEHLLADSLLHRLGEGEDPAPEAVCELESVTTKSTCRLYDTPGGFVIASAKKLVIKSENLDIEDKFVCEAEQLCRVELPKQGHTFFICDGRDVRLTSSGSTKHLGQAASLAVVVNGTALESFGSPVESVKSQLRARGLLQHYDKHSDMYGLVAVLVVALVVIGIFVQCFWRIGARIKCRERRDWVPGEVVTHNSRCDI